MVIGRQCGRPRDCNRIGSQLGCVRHEAMEQEHAVSEAKTQPTAVSAADFIGAIEPAPRRADCQALMTLMQDITGEPAVMWGPSIIGFGRYRYTYDSGRSGEMCVTGFASRASDIAVYLVAEGDSQAALLQTLGKHKMGKACLYIKRLSDIDVAVLSRLIAGSVQAVKARWP